MGQLLKSDCCCCVGGSEWLTPPDLVATTMNFSGGSSTWSKYEQFMEQADSFILDQIRLLSLESLYRKTVEYHYNCHNHLPSSSCASSRDQGINKESHDPHLNLIEITYFDDKT
jgi:hypothetical protein